jgi:hypothetical protein
MSNCVLFSILVILVHFFMLINLQGFKLLFVPWVFSMSRQVQSLGICGDLALGLWLILVFLLIKGIL